MGMKKRISAELIKRAMLGDEDAFNEIYSVFAKTILFNTHNMIIDKENVEDVAQEIALVMAKRINTLNSPFAFSSWLHRIIFNVCTTHNEKIKQTVSLDTEIESGKEPAEDRSENIPQEAAENVTVNELIADSIDRLPEAQRNMLVMRYYDDMSYKEIAKATNVAIGTVSSTIRKAKTGLKKILEKNKVGIDGVIKSALIVRADSVVTNHAVSKFTESAAYTAKGVFAEAGAAGKTAAIKAGSSVAKQTIAYICTAVIIVSGAGLLTWTVANNAGNSANNEVTEPVGNVPAGPYEPNAKISMNGNGANENTDPEEAKLSISDENIYEVTIAWDITTSEKESVKSGKGDTVKQELQGLAPGEYNLFFYMTNSKGQTATVTRTFFIS
jgi:RNA polymerase sigma-70 factor (ECF subfamily)